MPANSKYLSTSPWQRFAKISAAIIGGYFISIALHLALACWINPVNVIISSTYTGFILWVAFMILAFLGENGWKVWRTYLLIITLLAAITFLGKLSHHNFII